MPSPTPQNFGISHSVAGEQRAEERKYRRQRSGVMLRCITRQINLIGIEFATLPAHPRPFEAFNFHSALMVRGISR